jgi:peptidoglycan/LPS O-acetylase OafA/YrhL
MSRSRIPELDLLRFTAAAAVLAFHFYVLLPGDTGVQRAISAAGRFGFLGVPLFFMISGFVILWTAFNRSPGEFVLARLCRLYPSYWICVLITSGVLALAGGPPSWRQIAANLTMFHHLFGFDSIDEVYWTLFVELKFYGLVFILLACRQLPRIERWLRVWLALSAVSLLVGLRHHGAVRGLDTVVFEGDAAFFACGCYAYLIRTQGGVPARWIAFGVSAVLSVCAVLKTQSHYTFSSDWATLVTVVMVMMAACAALLAVATRSWSLPSTSLWYWLGSLTYPLYLLHAMAGKAFYGMLPLSWGLWPRMAVSLGAVAAVTMLLAVGIEQRGCAALYRYLSGIARPKPAPAPGVAEARPKPLDSTAG